MKRKTVLAFIDWYRPGYKAGGTITAFGNFVDHLEEELEFKIVTRDCDYTETETYPHITLNSWTDLSKTSVFYLSKYNTNFSKIKDLVSSSEFDWLYVNGIFSVYFSILPLWFAKNKKCIVNPHGMLSDQAFSVKKLKKIVFLTIANGLGLYKNIIFHVANENERLDVIKRVKRFKNIRVINQLPRKIEKSVSSEPKKKSEVLKFVTVARISVEKGILESLSALSKITQDINFDIYGAIYDEMYWKKCQEVIARLPSNIFVNYKGSIDGRHMIETLNSYDFFILLSKGENFGHAILEALSAGCPVLISNQTPWKDLQTKKIGWDIDIEDPNDVARCVKAACHLSKEDYQTWSDNAIKYSIAFSENPKLLQSNLNLFQ
ncbi:glycosyltransferase [uncultured Gelidibacter sp.]|uniref:glycosyltransferase n=1 Tax=uncultured Gelidibacter sp. TaxID=259318 RepID=UPI00262B2519|nr:glycosyltransferase [uncultured Gelidibacter sp.]